MNAQISNSIFEERVDVVITKILQQICTPILSIKHNQGNTVFQPPSAEKKLKTLRRNASVNMLQYNKEEQLGSHCWTRKAVNYLLKISFSTYIEIDNHTLFSLVVALYVHRKIILILMLDVADDNLLKRKFLIDFPMREMLSRWKIDNSFNRAKRFFFFKERGNIVRTFNQSEDFVQH